MDFRRLPICILSHDRPAYLRPMLEALAAAMAEAGMFGPVLLFQDGARDGADPRPAAACVQAFHTALPHGVAFGSAEHLGIARNLHRAETWAFDSMRYPAALFFEDDLVVGRSYFRAMAALGEQAPAKVALFSASGLDPRATRPEQVERRRQVGPLVRDWGYCLTREAWLKCQPHWRDYLDLLDGGEPRLDRVAAWYGRLGWPPLPAHQSFAKSVLLNTLGYARIGSVANCARNIGAAGHLYTPAEFQRHGFADAALLEDGDWQFDALDDAQLDGIVLAQRQAALRQRLGADSFIGNQALIDALRLLRHIDGAKLLRIGEGKVASASGFYPDRWAHPLATIGFPPVLSVRELTLDAIAAQHLPRGASLEMLLNGQLVAAVWLDPGEPFTCTLLSPPRLDGLEKLLTARCSVNTDPYSVGFNEDRRKLSFLLLSLTLEEADGSRTKIAGEDIVGRTSPA